MVEERNTKMLHEASTIFVYESRNGKQRERWTELKAKWERNAIPRCSNNEETNSVVSLSTVFEAENVSVTRYQLNRRLDGMSKVLGRRDGRLLQVVSKFHAQSHNLILTGSMTNSTTFPVSVRASSVLGIDGSGLALKERIVTLAWLYPHR
jgi:hypothetical protein